MYFYVLHYITSFKAIIILLYYWMRKKMIQCYPDEVNSWVHEWNLKIFNAGALGGHKRVISCMLNCITNNFSAINGAIAILQMDLSTVLLMRYNRSTVKH